MSDLENRYPELQGLMSPGSPISLPTSDITSTLANKRRVTRIPLDKHNSRLLKEIINNYNVQDSDIQELVSQMHQQVLKLDNFYEGIPNALPVDDEQMYEVERYIKAIGGSISRVKPSLRHLEPRCASGDTLSSFNTMDSYTLRQSKTSDSICYSNYSTIGQSYLEALLHYKKILDRYYTKLMTNSNHRNVSFWVVAAEQDDNALIPLLSEENEPTVMNLKRTMSSIEQLIVERSQRIHEWHKLLSSTFHMESLSDDEDHEMRTNRYSYDTEKALVSHKHSEVSSNSTYRLPRIRWFYCILAMVIIALATCVVTGTVGAAMYYNNLSYQNKISLTRIGLTNPKTEMFPKFTNEILYTDIASLGPIDTTTQSTTHFFSATSNPSPTSTTTPNSAATAIITQLLNTNTHKKYVATSMPSTTSTSKTSLVTQLLVDISPRIRGSVSKQTIHNTDMINDKPTTARASISLTRTQSPEISSSTTDSSKAKTNFNVTNLNPNPFTFRPPATLETRSYDGLNINDTANNSLNASIESNSTLSLTRYHHVGSVNLTTIFTTSEPDEANGVVSNNGSVAATASSLAEQVDTSLEEVKTTGLSSQSDIGETTTFLDPILEPNWNKVPQEHTNTRTRDTKTPSPSDVTSNTTTEVAAVLARYPSLGSSTLDQSHMVEVTERQLATNVSVTTLTSLISTTEHLEANLHQHPVTKSASEGMMLNTSMATNQLETSATNNTNLGLKSTPNPLASPPANPSTIVTSIAVTDTTTNVNLKLASLEKTASSVANAVSPIEDETSSTVSMTIVSDASTEKTSFSDVSAASATHSESTTPTTATMTTLTTPLISSQTYIPELTTSEQLDRIKDLLVTSGNLVVEEPGDGSFTQEKV